MQNTQNPQTNYRHAQIEKRTQEKLLTCSPVPKPFFPKTLNEPFHAEDLVGTFKLMAAPSLHGVGF